MVSSQWSDAPSSIFHLPLPVPHISQRKSSAVKIAPAAISSPIWKPGEWTSIRRRWKRVRRIQCCNSSSRARRQHTLARARPPGVIKSGAKPCRTSGARGNANGVLSFSPGLARSMSDYPGDQSKTALTPTGLCLCDAPATTPLGLARVDLIPRVARASQPWAGGHNAFGVSHHI